MWSICVYWSLQSKLFWFLVKNWSKVFSVSSYSQTELTLQTCSSAKCKTIKFVWIEYVYICESL